MADWLRPVFARTRSSLQIGSLSIQVDRSPSLNDEGNEDDLYIGGRPRPPSRVASFIGVPSIEIDSSSLAPEDFPRLLNPENVYHRPDCDYMAETLKVVMMTQDSLDPVPIIYNSHILHLLEAYQNGQEQLVRKQRIIEEVKEAHTQDLHEFASLAEGWEAKEKDYKAEVKRLELMLAKTEGGMATVAMARSKSKIHGSKRFSESLGRGFGTIKARHATRRQKDKEEEEMKRDAEFRAQASSQEHTHKVHFHNDLSALRNSSPVLPVIEGSERSSGSFVGPGLRSQIPRSGLQTPEIQDQAKYSQSSNKSMSFYGHILRRDHSRQSLHTPEPIQEPNDPARQSLQSTSDHLKASRRHDLWKDHEMSSSSLASSSGSDLFGDQMHGSNTLNALGIKNGLDEKPLPDIPDSLEKHFSLMRPSQLEPKPRDRTSKHMSFSFQPGDDSDILSPTIGGDFKKRERLEEYINHLEGERNYKYPPRHQRPKSISSPDVPSRKMDHLEKSPDGQKSPSKKHSQTSPDESNSPYRKGSASSTLTRIPQRTPDNQNKSLARDDSSSSAVTAVRHNSGQSSMNIHDSAQNTRPALRNQIGSGSGSGRGSSEAVAAAAWAFSGSKNSGTGKPNSSRLDIGVRAISKQYDRDSSTRGESTRRSDGNGAGKERQITWKSNPRAGASGREEVKKPDRKITAD